MSNNMIQNGLRINQYNISNLDKLFFSKENIELINKKLILLVYKKTNNTFLISNQNEDDLLVIMRYFSLIICDFSTYKTFSSLPFKTYFLNPVALLIE